MPKQAQAPQAVESHQRPGTSVPKHEPHNRVTNKNRSSLAASIASAIVIKDEDISFLSESDGSVPRSGKHGFGLYYRDCRFLNGYEMELANVRPITLVATAPKGFKAELVLTNPDLRLADGQLVQKEDLVIAWERVLDSSRTALCDRLTLVNYGTRVVTLPLSLSFGAEFEDVFVVRGMPAKKRGKLHTPSWKDGVLFFRYDGSDDVYRSLTVHFSPAPDPTKDATAQFELRLEPHKSQQLSVTLTLAESRQKDQVKPGHHPQPDFQKVADSLERSAGAWLEQQTQAGAALQPRLLARGQGRLCVGAAGRRPAGGGRRLQRRTGALVGYRGFR